ncbi:MAG: hypothetical protein QOE61_1912, partial [Micromonosporaceae bacterium]|nr:hypothetical protein [Micromonosporaceae bacterium]
MVLFWAYRRMSHTQPLNADGASQALQGWDLLHGNLLLHGWTVSDVSFYTNEVLVFAVVEAIHGLNPDALHIVAAVVYTALVLAVALLARGRATGRAAVARIAVAVAIMLVPASGMGSWVLLGSSDHTGTGVPLLLTWLVLDRALTDPSRRAAPRWLPYALAALLTWGQISDPLVMFIGALPLAVLGLVRLFVARRVARRSGGAGRAAFDWRGTDARLVAAALGSIVLTRLAHLMIEVAGGFQAHGVPVRLVSPDRVGANLSNTGETLALLFGGYFPDRAGVLDVTMGAVRLLGLFVVAAAVCVMLVKSWRAAIGAGSEPSMVDQLLALAVVVNLGAFVVSTLPWDLTSARQLTAILTLGAVLAGRVWGPQLAEMRWLPAAVAVMVLVYGGEFVARTTERPVPAANAELAGWLEAHGLSYGLAGFWSSNDVTLITSGRVRVAPVTGEAKLYGYRWLSNADWYDPGAHDARFMIVDRRYPPYGTEAGAAQSFGPPIARHEVG